MRIIPKCYVLGTTTSALNHHEEGIKKDIRTIDKLSDAIEQYKNGNGLFGQTLYGPDREYSKTGRVARKIVMSQKTYDFILDAIGEVRIVGLFDGTPHEIDNSVPIGEILVKEAEISEEKFKRAIDAMRQAREEEGFLFVNASTMEWLRQNLYAYRQAHDGEDYDGFHFNERQGSAFFAHQGKISNIVVKDSLGDGEIEVAGNIPDEPVSEQDRAFLASMPEELRQRRDRHAAGKKSGNAKQVRPRGRDGFII